MTKGRAGANRNKPRGFNHRAAVKYLDRENAKWPDELKEISSQDWPDWQLIPGRPLRAMRSRNFLLMVFQERSWMRLSVCRTRMLSTGRWDDGISWDELQDLKRQAGFGDVEAVEVYPPEHDVVNVANFRHLWLIPRGRRLPFSWTTVNDREYRFEPTRGD